MIIQRVPKHQGFFFHMKNPPNFHPENWPPNTRMRRFKWLLLLQQTFLQRIGLYMRYWRTSTGETGQVSRAKLVFWGGEVEITKGWMMVDDGHM